MRLFAKRRLSKRELRRLRLVGVHLENHECRKYGCVVHHWSKHHMRKMPLIWRDDRALFERICKHGVGHPDPDGVNFMIRKRGLDAKWEAVHGCDGCCSPDKRKRPDK